MAYICGRGNFIGGQFLLEGESIVSSYNPSADFIEVFSVKTSLAHVEKAVLAAKNAFIPWASVKQEERNQCLIRLKRAFLQHSEPLARAITLEMGKPIRESREEAKNLSARIDLMLSLGLTKLKNEHFPSLCGEKRFHPQGVLAIIGPYNFPLHLINAQVIPALLSGNTVVIKPSEICPWSAELYAQCFDEAQFPKGVINLVHGDGTIGRALCLHASISGVLFTGSHSTGQILQKELFSKPHKILALEMGGKNFSVVMNDANMTQSLKEILTGAFLTSGQRCTATSRVLCHKDIYEKFKNELINSIQKITPGDPLNDKTFFGPLATKKGLEKFWQKLQIAKENSATVLVESKRLSGGAFVTPSLYEVGINDQLPGYLDEELFGPHITLEKFNDLGDAIERINESPFGLANAIFTLNNNYFEEMFFKTRSGILNLNRSTNGAIGSLPFGGVNQSGNYRPSGIDAVFYTTYPVACILHDQSQINAPKELQDLVKIEEKEDIYLIQKRHQIEKIFENYGINSYNSYGEFLIYQSQKVLQIKDILFDNLKNSIKIYNYSVEFNLNYIEKKDILMLQNLCEKYLNDEEVFFPKNIHITDPSKQESSKNALARFYNNDLVPREKKSPVIDLNKSKKAYLVSIDEEPLVLFDAASQIATLGAGFMADFWQNAYDVGDFDFSLIKNTDLSLENHDENDEFYQDALQTQKEFEQFLLNKSHGHFQSVSYGTSGAEANELAFELCQKYGSGGKRVIAFEGSFHGRTLMALQATYNLDKRGPFQFKGFEATFLPWPNQILHEKDLIKKEEEILHQLLEEIHKKDVLCVIIEPIQCEGGDNYARKEFFQSLRKITQDNKIPLVIDEVQTGFNLGHNFYWYQGFDILPDCITLGKKAQLGAVLSIWPSLRKQSPHIIQLKRGLLHGQAMDQEKALWVEKEVLKKLSMLKEQFPKLVHHERVCGFAFAFDMPTTKLAQDIIDQRFARGFMAYIAGEKTLRFRLNTSCSKEDIALFFNKIFGAFLDLSENKPLSLPQKNYQQNINELKNYKIIKLNHDNVKKLIYEIEKIESITYEEGRRDSIEDLLAWLKEENNICLALSLDHSGEEELLAYAFGGPLSFAKVDGAKQDPLRKKNFTYYSANITVNPKWRSQGYGRILKNEQIKQARSLGYCFMSSRNRLGYAMHMVGINEELGAYKAGVFSNQYGDENGQALYYRLPLKKSYHPIKEYKKSHTIDLRNTTEYIFQDPPASLLDDLQNNNLRGMCGTKLTLSNFSSMNQVRYSELVRAVMPLGLNHLYFTSGQGEVVDKALRALRFYRRDADMVIGFSHQYFGHTTAGARSLSHNETSYFKWPFIPHPEVVGEKQSIAELYNILNKYNKERILCIVLELIGKNNSYTFSDNFLAQLDDIRNSFGIPIVYNETVSSFYRNGQSFFYTDSLKVKPNLILWFCSGQLGHVLTDDQYYVEKPLTLISTWDGDDISIMRNYHNILNAQKYCESLKPFIDWFDSLKLSHKKSGLGYWRSIEINDKKKMHAIVQEAKQHNLLLNLGDENRLMVCPKFGQDIHRIKELAQIVKD